MNLKAVNKHNYLLSFGLLFMIGISVSAQSKDPVETVKSFYKFHLSRSGIFSLHEVKIRKRWFTGAFYRLLLFELTREDEFTRKNPSDKPYFGDGFPFEPLEECVVDEKSVQNRYQIRQVSAEGAKAMVEIKFYVPKECEDEVAEKLLDTYQIELLKTRNVWLINDWFYRDQEKLSQTLKREKY